MFEGSKTKKQLKELENQLNSLISEKLMLENKLEESLNTIETFASAKNVYEKLIKSSNKELTDMKSIHKIELDKLNDSVNKKVNMALAGIGVSLFANENFVINSQKSDMELLNKFNNLADDEKTEFYQKYKAAISRALLIKQ